MSYRFCWTQGSLADPQSLLGCSNEDQQGPPHSFFKIASLVAMHYPGCYSLSGHFFDFWVSSFISLCSLPWNSHLISQLPLLFLSSSPPSHRHLQPLLCLVPIWTRCSKTQTKHRTGLYPDFQSVPLCLQTFRVKTEVTEVILTSASFSRHHMSQV